MITDGEQEILQEQNRDAAEDAERVECPACGSSRVSVYIAVDDSGTATELECDCLACGVSFYLGPDGEAK